MNRDAFMGLASGAGWPMDMAALVWDFDGSLVGQLEGFRPLSVMTPDEVLPLLQRAQDYAEGRLSLAQIAEQHPGAVVFCGDDTPELQAQMGARYLTGVKTTCADCGGKIIHSPHAPKEPLKLCHPCGEKRLSGPGGGLALLVRDWEARRRGAGAA